MPLDLIVNLNWFIAKGHRSTRFKKQYPTELRFYGAFFMLTVDGWQLTVVIVLVIVVVIVIVVINLQLITYNL
jgi:ABC-type multidrug transport system fused ATPase/permease subunit